MTPLLFLGCLRIVYVSIGCGCQGGGCLCAESRCFKSYCCENHYVVLNVDII